MAATISEQGSARGAPSGSGAGQTEAGALAQREPTAKEIRLVVGASSAGTVFEWYDFFIYGTLAYILKDAFYDVDDPTLGLLLVWSTFAVGFAFRPIGAILFGFLGDRLGRKYTFLVTVTLMGIATAGVGFIPTVDTIGVAAPVIVILLRVIQGLALGGEYGGAAIYVAEHSRRKSAASTPVSSRPASRAGSCCRSSWCSPAGS